MTYSGKYHVVWCPKCRRKVFSPAAWRNDCSC
ncbi:MAG: hypothetical protein DMG42_19300 [Acidobacteria bacterium]|nr:MAG: hypothetical protein DMG42_19300 [Acidobacteriota bacterium]